MVQFNVQQNQSQLLSYPTDSEDAINHKDIPQAPKVIFTEAKGIGITQ